MRALLCVLTLAFAAATAARADEVKIDLDKVPAAVTAAVKKRFPKAEAVEAAKETDGDKTVYEVTVKDGGTKIDVTLTPQGVITMIERTIAAKALPKAVTDTLAEKYPKAAFKIVEEVIAVKDGKESLDYYETLLETADKKLVEVEITADGKIKKTEDKKPGDKD